MTNFPTSLICSTATIVSPRPTKTTRTIVSTVVHVERHSTNSPRKSGDEDSSSPKMNSLSTLPIVVIAVSGIVTVGLGFSCYIWRRRNSARLLSFSVLKYIELFCIISKGHKKHFFFVESEVSIYHHRCLLLGQSQCSPALGLGEQLIQYNLFF